MPKSRTLSTLTSAESEARAKKRFSGFKSLCTTPALAARAITWASALMCGRSSAHAIGPPRLIRAPRSSPLSSSIQSQGMPVGASTPAPITSTVCGVSRRAAMRASRENRSRRDGSSKNSRRITFRARRRSVLSWRTTKTLPIPPLFRCDSTRNSPANVDPIVSISRIPSGRRGGCRGDFAAPQAVDRGRLTWASRSSMADLHRKAAGQSLSDPFATLSAHAFAPSWSSVRLLIACCIRVWGAVRQLRGSDPPMSPGILARRGRRWRQRFFGSAPRRESPCRSSVLRTSRRSPVPASARRTHSRRAVSVRSTHGSPPRRACRSWPWAPAERPWCPLLLLLRCLLHVRAPGA